MAISRTLRVSHQYNTAIVIAVGAWLLLYANACSSGSEGGASAVPRDTVAGVEVVRNPATAVVPGARVDLLWEQHGPQAADVDESPQWEQPVAIVAGGSEVFVLDRLASRVHALAQSDGRVLRTFGRPGQGPGEFEGAFGIAVVDDSVIVGSSGTASLEVFHREGGYGRRIPLGQIGFRINTLPGRRLLLSGYAGAGSSPWTVWSLNEGTPPQPLMLPDTSVTGEELFSSCLPSAAVGESIVRVACRTPELVVYTASGRTLREIRVAVEPEITPDSELTPMIERLRNRLGEVLPPEQVRAFTDEMLERYRVKPKYMMVRGDVGSGLYAVREQNPDDLGGGPATLHIFDATGVYLSALAFERAWLDFDVRNGVVYALAEDAATGLAATVAYRLVMEER
jgi:hypothetical protein